MSSKNELLDEYVDLILPHLDAAKKRMVFAVKIPRLTRRVIRILTC